MDEWLIRTVMQLHTETYIRVVLFTSGLEITGFASQFVSQNQPVTNQINI